MVRQHCVYSLSRDHHGRFRFVTDKRSVFRLPRQRRLETVMRVIPASIACDLG